MFDDPRSGRPLANDLAGAIGSLFEVRPLSSCKVLCCHFRIGKATSSRILHDRLGLRNSIFAECRMLDRSSKSREYCLIDRTAFHIWSFGRGGLLSARKLSAASIFSHRRGNHSAFPKRAYKIVVDGIETHPFHPEIEDDWLLVHQATDPKRPSFTSFFPKKRTGKRL
jgi:hypothetical protein